MKILSVHIENFGKLQDTTIDFESNPFIINEDNAWGKSTLAAFIKVLFFGFQNEGKQKISENERKRFRPWQGGVYGGRLCFETKGKKYEINRTFGSKDKEDTFSLRDMDTNLISEDFSMKVGEELFGIDAESFERTVYMVQNDCITAVTDSIHAKIGNLTDHTDDINNYETVNEKLHDMLNNLSERRKTGELFKLHEKIESEKMEIRRGAGIEEAIEQIDTLLHGEIEKKEGMKLELTELQSKIDKESARKETLAKKENYLSLCNVNQVKQEDLSLQRSYFPGVVPNAEDCDQMDRICGEVNRYHLLVEQLRFKNEEEEKYHTLFEQYHDGRVDDEEIQSALRDVDAIDELRLQEAKVTQTPQEKEKYEKLSKQFERGIPNEAVLEQRIRNWNTQVSKKNSIEMRKLSLTNLIRVAELKKVKKVNYTPLLFVCIVFLLVGVVGLFWNLILGACGIGIGLITGLSFFLLKNKQTKREKDAKAESEDADNEIDELRAQITEDEIYIEKTEREMREFLQTVSIPYEETEIITSLLLLKAQISDFKELEQKRALALNNHAKEKRIALEDKLLILLKAIGIPEEKLTEYKGVQNPYRAILQEVREQNAAYRRLHSRYQEFCVAEQKYMDSKEQMKSLFDHYNMTVEGEYSQKLREIREHSSLLGVAEREALRAQKAKEDFESCNDIEQILALNPADNEKSLAELNEDLSKHTEILDMISRNIADYRRRLDEQKMQKDEIDELALTLEKDEEDYRELKHKFDIISQTAECLGQAKTAITAKYTTPIMSAFQKYYEILTAMPADEMLIDANINITAREQGEQRDTKLLSTGYQDLIGICMRMALTDAMYQGEKPFIIFDDPFVNLDSPKVKGGLELLRIIAHEYQVIYFTCHNSRA